MANPNSKLIHYIGRDRDRDKVGIKSLVFSYGSLAHCNRQTIESVKPTLSISSTYMPHSQSLTHKSQSSESTSRSPYQCNHFSQLPMIFLCYAQHFEKSDLFVTVLKLQCLYLE
jgi:hypothetical protein